MYPFVYITTVTMRALILLALLGTALAMPQSGSRIEGGSPTTVEQYPYMVKMQYSVFAGAFWLTECGGSLLSSRVVLSDASCYITLNDVPDEPSRWRAVLGTSYLSSGGSEHPLARITLHPEFNRRFYENNLSILHLMVPAVYSASVRAARIPASNFLVPDGAVVTAIGWGALSMNGAFPEQLQHVDLNVINTELCAARYVELQAQHPSAGIPKIDESMLCAGILDVGGKDTCSRDIGGPLAYMGDIVVGVISWGLRCADPYYPGTNVRVSHYTDWILANA